MNIFCGTEDKFDHQHLSQLFHEYIFVYLNFHFIYSLSDQNINIFSPVLVFFQNLQLSSPCAGWIYVLEVILKVYAYGFVNYWRDGQNRFDFVITWVIGKYSNQVPSTPTF